MVQVAAAVPSSLSNQRRQNSIRRFGYFCPTTTAMTKKKKTKRQLFLAVFFFFFSLLLLSLFKIILSDGFFFFSTTYSSSYTLFDNDSASNSSSVTKDEDGDVGTAKMTMMRMIRTNETDMSVTKTLQQQNKDEKEPNTLFGSAMSNNADASTPTPPPPSERSKTAVIGLPSRQTNIRHFQVIREQDLADKNEEEQQQQDQQPPLFQIDYFSNTEECTRLTSPDQISFTLTTQLSMDRLWIMKYQCQRWPSPLPISIAIYYTTADDDAADARQTKNRPNETDTDVDEEEMRLRTTILKLLDSTLECDVSRMYVTILLPQDHNDNNNDNNQYPVNTLRNLAFEQIPTTHAMYIDSDFLISDRLYDDLLLTAKSIFFFEQEQQQKANSSLSTSLPVAIVVPAFEYISSCTFQTQQEAIECMTFEFDNNNNNNNIHHDSNIPKSHSDILKLLNRTDPPRVERGFQKITTKDGKTTKNRYHGTTLYDAWANGTTTTTTTTARPGVPIQIPCVKSRVYEPYLAVRVCRDLPKFPTIFKGWGYNKLIWVKLLLKKLGYRLWQIPNGFVVHLPHEYSTARKYATKNKKEDRSKTKNKKKPQKQPRPFDPYLQWLETVPAHPNHLPHCFDWKREQQKQQ